MKKFFDGGAIILLFWMIRDLSVDFDLLKWVFLATSTAWLLGRFLVHYLPKIKECK